MHFAGCVIKSFPFACVNVGVCFSRGKVFELCVPAVVFFALHLFSIFFSFCYPTNLIGSPLPVMKEVSQYENEEEESFRIKSFSESSGGHRGWRFFSALPFTLLLLLETKKKKRPAAAGEDENKGPRPWLLCPFIIFQAVVAIFRETNFNLENFT